MYCTVLYITACECITMAEGVDKKWAYGYWLWTTFLIYSPCFTFVYIPYLYRTLLLIVSLALLRLYTVKVWSQRNQKYSFNGSTHVFIMDNPKYS